MVVTLSLDSEAVQDALLRVMRTKLSQLGYIQGTDLSKKVQLLVEEMPPLDEALAGFCDLTRFKFQLKVTDISF